MSPSARRFGTPRESSRRGLKINRFLEQIIWERLEDEMDAEIANLGEDAQIDLDNLRDSAA